LGLNRTTTGWLAPGSRLNELPATTMNGSTAKAVPVTALLPGFATVNERSADPPTGTDPKS